MAKKIRVAQFGVRHGHAKAILEAFLNHPDVEVAGLYEQDPALRQRVAQSGDPIWNRIPMFDDPRQVLEDPKIVAVANEGANRESLGYAEAIVAAGKHVFYDKPAGDDLPRFERLTESARRKDLRIQLGYMFRSNAGFQQITEWARSGFLGHIFQVRLHMSTGLHTEKPEIGATGRINLSHHRAGIMYDLGGHMVDQIVWMLGRPNRVTPFLLNTGEEPRDFIDNTLAVLEYNGAMATIDIAATEVEPSARRIEVYGTEGSAIMQPFEPAHSIRLVLDEARDGHVAGESTVDVGGVTRKDSHRVQIDTFVKSVGGEVPAERSLDHELLVQETLMRCTGSLAG